MLEERALQQNIESRENDEPSVCAQPVTATEAAAVVPLDEPDLQHLDANEPTLAKLEGTKDPSLPVEAAATTPLTGSANNQRRPRNDLLEHQLTSSVTRGHNQEKQQKLSDGAVDLYDALAPKDAIDSMLGSAMVALSNATMNCFDRANWGFERSRELNLRYGIKGAATLAELSKLYDSRRGQGQQAVTVGKVNVEAGGQAIVGNVDSRDRRKRATKSKSTRSSRAQRATPKRRQG
jgi:hypothetical protein